MGEQVQSSSTTTCKADISRLDLRVGDVELVTEHPFDKKYFLVHINANEDTERRTAIPVGHILVRQQIDRQKVVIVCNIKGMTQGLFNDCFIVFAKSGNQAELLIPPGEAESGQRVYVPGYPFDPFQDWPYLPDDQARKIFYEAVKHVKADMKNGLVRYKGIPLRTVVDGDFRIQPQTLWSLRI